METNNKNIDGRLEKLALLCDATQSLFPEGKQAIIFELNQDDFKDIQSNFRRIDSEYKRFQIDMSGVECVFINTEIYNTIDTKDEVIKTEEIIIEEKPTFFQRLKDTFFGNKSR